MIEYIIHGSASKYGNAALFALWHGRAKPEGRGWNGIGYHFVILNGWLAKGVYNKYFDGHIETGRPLDDDPFFEKNEIGAHTRGRNWNTISGCLVGLSGQYTDNQYEVLLRNIFMIDQIFGGVKISQHSQFEPKKPGCAGVNINQIRDNYEIFKELND